MYLPYFQVILVFKIDRVSRIDFQNNSYLFSSGHNGLLFVEVCFLAWVIFCTVYWSSLKKNKKTKRWRLLNILNINNFLCNDTIVFMVYLDG